MGIKFRCPNGHKLHVKAFLAGKRGICPKCGTKFDIPLVSGGRVSGVGPTSPLLGGVVAPTHDNPTPATSVIIPTTAQPEPTLSQASVSLPTLSVSTSVDPLAEIPDVLWHIRSASGGQFGPAAADVMRQWLDEGRITGDSFVWHDGWAEWCKASEVFPQLTETDATFTPTLIPATSSSSVSPASRRKKGRHKSKQSAMMLSAILFLAVVLLAIVLGIVFLWQ